MYKMHFIVAFTTGLITYIFVCDREKELWDGANKMKISNLKSYNSINDDQGKDMHDIANSFW